jgi:hypothetical protein
MMGRSFAIVVMTEIWTVVRRYSVVIVSNQALNPAPLKAWQDKKIPSIAVAVRSAS